jgi:hypothetical protein
VHSVGGTLVPGVSVGMGVVGIGVLVTGGKVNVGNIRKVTVGVGVEVEVHVP